MKDNKTINVEFDVKETNDKIIVEPRNNNNTTEDKTDYQKIYEAEISFDEKQKRKSEKLRKNEDNAITVLSHVYKIPFEAGIDIITKTLKNSLDKILLKSGSSWLLSSLFVGIEINRTKGEEGEFKATVTSTIKMGTGILATIVISFIITKNIHSALLAGILAFLLSNIVSILIDIKGEDVVNDLYDRIFRRATYNKKTKDLSIETSEKYFDKTKNLITHLDKTEDINNIFVQHENNSDKKLRELFFKASDKQHLKDLCIFKNDNIAKNIPNIKPKNIEKEIIKCFHKADMMLVEKFKEIYGDNIKVTIDYSNTPLYDI